MKRPLRQGGRCREDFPAKYIKIAGSLESFMRFLEDSVGALCNRQRESENADWSCPCHRCTMGPRWLPPVCACKRYKRWKERMEGRESI